MSNRTRLSTLSMLLGLAVLLSACGGTATEPTATPAAGGTSAATQTPSSGSASTPAPGTADQQMVRLGFAFVTSGDNGAYGQSQRRASELAWHEIEAKGGINGHHIAATFEDTAGKPDQAITIFQKFINTDDVLAIVGPTLNTEATSSDPIAQRNQVPVLGVSSTASGITDMGDFIFSDSLADFQVIPETIKQAKAKLGITKVSILYGNDDAFTKSGYDVFKQSLADNNIQVLSEQTFASTDTDFKPQLTRIKAENPDAIVVSALARAGQTILQQARTDVGIDPKVHIIGGNGFNSPAVLKAAGPAAEGLIVGAAWNINAGDPTNQQFIANYKKAYGTDPDQFAAQAYAGFYILADAVTRAKLTDLTHKAVKDNRIKVRDALRATRDVPTVLGPFSFTDKRDANHPPVVQIVKNGKFDVLK